LTFDVKKVFIIPDLKKYFRVNRKSEFGCHKVLYKLITFDLQEFMTVVK
jgi:hypothetical protein